MQAHPARRHPCQRIEWRHGFWAARERAFFQKRLVGGKLARERERERERAALRRRVQSNERLRQTESHDVQCRCVRETFERSLGSSSFAGELQVSETERASKSENLFHDIATIVSEKALDPRTGLRAAGAELFHHTSLKPRYVSKHPKRPRVARGRRGARDARRVALRRRGRALGQAASWTASSQKRARGGVTPLRVLEKRRADGCRTERKTFSPRSTRLVLCENDTGRLWRC